MKNYLAVFTTGKYMPKVWYGISTPTEWPNEVSQSCPTLCDHMNCSLPHSSIHGIFQARVLEWVAISFSRGSSQPRDRTQVSLIVGRCFTVPSLFLKEMNIYVHKKNIQKKVHSGTLLNLLKLETTQTSINREWINKLWFLYTLECYTAIS